MYFVYILYSKKDNIRYIGITLNIKNRLMQHNNGLVTSTRFHIPYALVWFCGFHQKKTALQFEKYLKSSSGYAFTKKHLIS